ncbi:IMP dehydrogenase, partial [Staphylococcus epidermidis]|uniref:IMP dehydrogenase n=1 Tax=Staphylococcus epidermidis TaxID=1282 RepID=UPI00164251DD
EKVVEFAYAAKDEDGRLLGGGGMGRCKDSEIGGEKVVEGGVDGLIIDRGDGDCKGVINEVKEMKERYGEISVVGGKVGSGEGRGGLFEGGGDVVKV